EQLNRIAHYDQLTGLPNRLTLQKELGRLLSGDGQPTAIALFDLDGFKDVNDTLGHSTGDQLLVEVGQRLVGVAGGGGQVCRFGGDESALITPGSGNPPIAGGRFEPRPNRLPGPSPTGDHAPQFGARAAWRSPPTAPKGFNA